MPRFGVKLGSNSAGVTTAGAGKITTLKDTYELSKALHDPCFIHASSMLSQF